MAAIFDRDDLLSAFDRLGEAACRAGTVLHIAVYGGSALMLASNFRFASEDVDVAELPKPWPEWLTREVEAIATERGWSRGWLNEAVEFHLSPLASRERDHLEFGTFPRAAAEPGMVIYVPTADYLLALKLKAIRVLDPVKGAQEGADIRNLMAVAGIENAEAAIEVLARYFPRSAADSGKQLFLLRHLLQTEGGADAPQYPVGGG